MLSKKNKIILFVLLSFSGIFFFTHSADAFVFDWAMAALDALDTVDMAVLSFIIKLVIYAFLSSAFVLLGAHLLEWAIELPLHLSNPAVLGGWNFVLGFVNLGFVLALIFIALAYIMRLPRYELKKTLPRLILVILLVNFSMLIIGMFADIAQFFMNTLLNSFGKDFVELATMPLRQNLGILTGVFISTLVAYLAAAASVFLAPIVLGYLLADVVWGNMLGNIFSIITMTGMNLAMGGIFFVYAVLFVIRIAALWILAIFSPLAFFCLIFDQTKQYFDKWFKMVIGWAFLGVVALFLLGIIISLFSTSFLSRPGQINLSGGTSVPSFSLPSSLYNYLFLLIFLAVAFHISITYVPAGADVAIGYLKKGYASVGGVAGVINKGKRMGTEVTRRAVPQKYRQRVVRKARKMSASAGITDAESAKGVYKDAMSKEGTKGKAKSLISGFASPAIKRQLGKAIVSATSGASKRVSSETEEKMKGKSVEEKMKTLSETKGDRAKTLGIVKSIIEEKQLGDAMDEEKMGKGNTLKDRKVLKTKMVKGKPTTESISLLEDLYTEAINQNRDSLRKDIEYNFAGAVPPEKFKEIAEREGVYTMKDKEKDAGKGVTNYAERIIYQAKDENQIKKLGKGWWKNDELMKAVHQFWSGRQISQAANIFGKEFIDKFNEHEKPADWYYQYNKNTGRQNNPSIPRWRLSTPAVTLGVSPATDKEGRSIDTKEKVEHLERKGREHAKEEKEKEKKQKRK